MPNVPSSSSAPVANNSTAAPQNPSQNNAASPKPAQNDPKAPSTNVAAPTNAAPEQPKLGQGGEQAVQKKFKLKVDGAEHEVDESEVIRRAQLSTAAHKRFEEANQLKQQNEQLINMLRTKFTDVIDDPRLGLDEAAKRQMLDDYYKRKYIEPEMLTPEQRKLKDAERQLQTYRDQENQRKQAEEQARLQQLEQYHIQNYQKIVVDALQTESLPKTEFTVRRMADLMLKNQQMGLELTPQQIATLVREDYQNEIKAVLGATDGDVLLKLLGDDVANKLRKADLARLRAGMPNLPQPTVDVAKTEVRKEGKRYKSMDEKRAEWEANAKAAAAAWKK